MSDEEFRKIMVAKLALGLLNSPFSIAWAKLIARKVLEQSDE